MDRVDSLYTINIEDSRSTLKDGVYVRLHARLRCQLRAFWFVNVQRFYSELDSRDFRIALAENRFLTHSAAHRETISFDAAGDYTSHIQLPDAESYLIASTENEKRREYPLVLIVHAFIDDEDRREFFQSPIQIAVLHVKSSVSTDPSTKFLMRISKLADGRSLVLQDIFTPGAFNSDDACAICLTERITHVLLPCKHGCVCRNCFTLVDKCPICQQRVTSYFQI